MWAAPPPAKVPPLNTAYGTASAGGGSGQTVGTPTLVGTSTPPVGVQPQHHPQPQAPPQAAHQVVHQQQIHHHHLGTPQMPMSSGPVAFQQPVIVMQQPMQQHSQQVYPQHMQQQHIIMQQPSMQGGYPNQTGMTPMMSPGGHAVANPNFQDPRQPVRHVSLGTAATYQQGGRNPQRFASVGSQNSAYDRMGAQQPYDIPTGRAPSEESAASSRGPVLRQGYAPDTNWADVDRDDAFHSHNDNL